MIRRLRTLLLSLAILTPLTLSLAAPMQAAAVNVLPCTGALAGTDVCKSVPNKGTAGNNPVIHALQIAITIISVVIGIAAVIVIILSGLRMIISNGDAQAIARARSSLIYALVGLAIAALAETFVTFVLSKL